MMKMLAIVLALVALASATEVAHSLQGVASGSLVDRTASVFQILGVPWNQWSMDLCAPGSCQVDEMPHVQTAWRHALNWDCVADGASGGFELAVVDILKNAYNQMSPGSPILTNSIDLKWCYPKQVANVKFTVSGLTGEFAGVVSYLANLGLDSIVPQLNGGQYFAALGPGQKTVPEYQQEEPKGASFGGQFMSTTVERTQHNEAKFNVVGRKMIEAEDLDLEERDLPPREGEGRDGGDAATPYSDADGGEGTTTYTCTAVNCTDSNGCRMEGPSLNTIANLWTSCHGSSLTSWIGVLCTHAKLLGDVYCIAESVLTSSGGGDKGTF